MSDADDISPSDDRIASWPYGAGPPQRYTQNYPRYLARGGLNRPSKDVLGFIAGQEGNRGDMARFYFFCLAFDQLMKEGIRGNFAELGVWKGNTAILLATMARRMGAIAYLLDTFEGFAKADLTGIDSRQKMQFEDTSLEMVRSRVGDHGVRYIKGYFPESASALPIDVSFCLVHIDCDLYAPMASALEYFYPRLQPGGFLIFHDYSSLHWSGAEKAVDEFFADKPEAVIPLTDSAGSALIRKVRNPTRYDNWVARSRFDVLAGRGWVSAAEGGLEAILGAGWSAPEKWGIWGVGPVHELNLYLSSPPVNDITLELDVYAALVGSRISQEVEVQVSGTLLEVWTFVRERNKGIRKVVIPRSVASAATNVPGIPAIRIEFRPKSVESPARLDPTKKDNRPLGLGLFAARVDGVF